MKQTSINIQPVKGGSEQHNKREKELDYVRSEFSCLNDYWESDTQSNRLAFCRENAKVKTGRKMQEKATPIREAVVVINENTTMADMQRLAEAYKKRFGIETFQIAIHKDEGHHKAKEWKPNLHAHLVFDWTDHETGKSIKLNRADMVELQTITAEVLGMERGISSDKKHLTAIQYKNKREEEQAARLSAEVKQLNVTKAQKEAAIKTAKEASKIASDGLKTIFGISAKDNEIKSLTEAKNAQRKEFEERQAQMQAESNAKIQNLRTQVQQLQAAKNKAEEAFKKEVSNANLFFSLWVRATEATAAIISFAKDSVRKTFTPEEQESVNQTLGNISVAERLRLGKELVVRTFQVAPAEYKGKFLDTLRQVERVANYSYKQKQEKIQARSRGERR